MKNFRLKDLREQRGVTQGELGKAAGVSGQSILNWENGIFSPSLEDLVFLADYFNVTLDYLVGRDHSKEVAENIATGLENLPHDDFVEFIRKSIDEMARRQIEEKKEKNEDQAAEDSKILSEDSDPSNQ